MAEVMTGERLQELCAKWQKRLRLEDWKVQTQLSRSNDFGNLHTSGRCSRNDNHKHVLIMVLDPSEMNTEGVFGDDPEQVLIHELLHLHFGPFEAKTGTRKDMAQEQAINCIAWALLLTDRENA